MYLKDLLNYISLFNNCQPYIINPQYKSHRKTLTGKEIMVNISLVCYIPFQCYTKGGEQTWSEILFDYKRTKENM